MHTLKPEEFFPLAGVNTSTFKASLTRGEGAFAMGLDRMLAGGNFIDLDAVAWRLVDDLARKGRTRKVAAAVVRGFNDVWCKAVAKADRTDEPVFLVIAEFGDDGINADFGTLPEFGEFDYRTAKNIPERMTLINISALLHRIRAIGDKIGLDLSAPFLPPLGNPEFERALADTRASREKMVTRVRFPRQPEKRA